MQNPYILLLTFRGTLSIMLYGCFSIKYLSANSVDPNQTASICPKEQSTQALHCLYLACIFGKHKHV